MSTAYAHPLRRAVRAQVDRIDGSWSEPAEQLPGTVDDPNTGEPLQPMAASDPASVERAVAAAHAVHRAGDWAASPADVRGLILEEIAAGLDDRIDELAYEDAMASGNPWRTTRQMASYLGPRVRSARQQLLDIAETTVLPAGGRDVRLLRRPLGPAAVLAPWNAPTFVAVAKVASALAAGCPVILKPSERAPAGCQILAEVVAAVLDRHGVDAAAFQLVHGAAAVGSQLAGDRRIRAISFTGGLGAGRAVAAAAAPHLTALQLELGGHNPAVVLPDADVPATAAALVDGMTKLNGQWCEAPGKVLAVGARVHDALVEALLAELATRRVGHCLDDDTDVGPLAYADHLAGLSGRIADLVSRGGRALTASELPDLDGWFMAPTVVVGLQADASPHELFGPVVTVHQVATVEEALSSSDGPETGLAGFVFGADTAVAVDLAARIPAGEVRVNGCKLADLADGSEQSFWNNAGIGGHGPTDMVRFFQGRRTVGVDDPALPV